MGGTISVQTQCCIRGDEEWEEEEEEEEDDGQRAREKLLVEPAHWNGRPPQRPPRSLSEATTILPPRGD